MPLNITTDLPNTTDETNRQHYNLAMLLLVAGVPKITTEKELSQFITRAILLDLATGASLVEFVKWVKSFGSIRTNCTALSMANVLKRSREHAERRTASALKRVGGEQPGFVPLTVPASMQVEDRIAETVG